MMRKFYSEKMETGEMISGEMCPVEISKYHLNMLKDMDEKM